jgi:small GTP-binding protein
VLVVTGEYAAPILRQMFDVEGFSDVRILAVENRFFGGNIKVAGLLTGQDLIDALAGVTPETVILVPDVCLSEGTVPRRPRSRGPRTLGHGRADDGSGPSCGVDVGAVPAGERVKPQVVIVGRPNVGKSSLVNRLAGKRVTVVEEHRGVTRDRKAVEVEWGGLSFDVVDTGGWLEAGDSLEAKVSKQAEAALANADLVLLVTDVTTGMVDEDTHAARWALRSGRPVLLVVNKVDDAQHEAAAWEFLGLGAGDPTR